MYISIVNIIIKIVVIIVTILPSYKCFMESLIYYTAVLVDCKINASVRKLVTKQRITNKSIIHSSVSITNNSKKEN